MINFGRKTVGILGVRVDDLTFGRALNIAERLAKSPGVSTIFTPNPEIIMEARKDQKFREILNSASVSIADGIGVVVAAKILGTPLPGRVSGFDLASALLENLRPAGAKIFLLGGMPGVPEKAKINIERKYPGITVCGAACGYFSKVEEDAIIEKINDSGAQILFVCMGAPLQEKWIFRNKNRLNVNLCAGLGGAVDVWAGNVRRAPETIVNLNLEWFYRALVQPKRFNRLAKIPKFLLAVAREKFAGRLEKNS
jgi:N-acetylglucosaminyldiphosphoundecaprenol N-acetyl-beta-D-mannosaminyltransferase